jgi:hypothetical protein
LPLLDVDSGKRGFAAELEAILVPQKIIFQSMHQKYSSNRDGLSFHQFLSELNRIKMVGFD